MSKICYSLLFVLFLGCSASPLALSQEKNRELLHIETATGERHEFQVELAESNAERARGLMYRQSMDEKSGMLFIYPRVQRITMWMKNTFIPLDMIFIDEVGQIVHIVERTVPESTQSIPSGGPVKAVLEINAGVSDRLEISEGDQIHHPAFE